jgi:hypothetical protein
MGKDRLAILSLVALGRITPREAERLLAAWNAGREELLIMGAAFLVCVAQSLPALERLARTLPERVPAIHHAVMAITFWIGGVL